MKTSTHLIARGLASTLLAFLASTKHWGQCAGNGTEKSPYLITLMIGRFSPITLTMVGETCKTQKIVVR